MILATDLLCQETSAVTFCFERINLTRIPPKLMGLARVAPKGSEKGTIDRTGQASTAWTIAGHTAGAALIP